MAEKTFTVKANKWGYIRRDHPSTHYNVSADSSYLIQGNELDWRSASNAKYMLFGFESYPAASKHCAIVGYQLTLQIDNDVRVGLAYDTFDEATVTWDTAPDAPSGSETWIEASSPGTFKNSSIQRGPDSPGYVWLSFLLTSNRAIIVSAAGYGDTYVSHIKKMLENGTAPTLKIWYDDSIKALSKIQRRTYPSGTVNPTGTIAFAWEYVQASSNIYPIGRNDYSQTSAKIYWRVAGASSWNVVNRTSQKSYTFPANTFPSASTIQWYLEGTDEDGTTTTDGTASNPYTFSTPTSTVTMTEKPEGTSYDTRNAQLFKWTLSTGQSVLPDYPQQSATLYWKLSTEGDGAWRSVTPASGSTKQITIPANTFPTSATIQWYITATDTGGHTSQLATQTFKTVSTTITPVTYPEGNNVSPAQNIIFGWRYACTYNDYDQASAVFHWRVSTDNAWTDISISGNVKQVEIPQHTFPTGNKTIQWYVEGTDSGGTHTQTTTRTFRTVTTQVTQQGGPTSGYCDPRYPITFSWYLQSGSGEDYLQRSAVFHWREAEAVSWTNVSVSGNTKSITFPANTFPVASEIEWYIEATDYGGTSSQTEEFSFSTAASTAYAVCISPVGRVEDGTKPITFTWDFLNEDGTEPTRVLLKWKYDTESASEWKTLLDTTDVVSEYTVQGEFFSAGSVEWKVSAWNRDNAQGPENMASFICMLAPDMPAGLRATSVPRTTVYWQSSGQEAYEITIDGIIEAREYGPAVSSWSREEPLPDGEHIITVRVQGVYGLWSNAATTSIYVTNVPATTITLTGEFGVDAALAWVYGAAITNPKPNVYRDGVRIAALSDVPEFTDRFALGEHEYYVTVWDDDGNYSISNTVTGTMEIDASRIGAVDENEWVELTLTENSDATENFQWSRSFALQTVRGASYPVLELGSREDLTASYTCAFKTTEEAKRLEALRGKVVVLKSRKENVIVGALTQLQKQVKHFYIAFSFSLQQIYWEDFIHDPDR